MCCQVNNVIPENDFTETQDALDFFLNFAVVGVIE